MSGREPDRHRAGDERSEASRAQTDPHVHKSAGWGQQPIEVLVDRGSTPHDLPIFPVHPDIVDPLAHDGKADRRDGPTPLVSPAARGKTRVGVNPAGTRDAQIRLVGDATTG